MAAEGSQEASRHDERLAPGSSRYSAWKRAAPSVRTIYRRKRYGKTRAEVRFDGMAGCVQTAPRGGSAGQIVIVIRDGVLQMRWMSAPLREATGGGRLPTGGKQHSEPLQIRGCSLRAGGPLDRRQYTRPVFESVTKPTEQQKVHGRKSHSRRESEDGAGHKEAGHLS